MSGGHFGYQQYNIHQIKESIQSIIDNNDDEALDSYGNKRGRHYSPETIKRLYAAVWALERAYIYAQRIDYLLSGDDSEKSFLERLDEELEGAR